MTQLVSLLSTGKGSWAQVAKLSKYFEESLLITNEFGREKFSPENSTTLIVCDLQVPVHVLQDTFIKELRSKIKGTEVALNMTSGSGDEHMALLSALLKLGLGIRLVVTTETGLVEL